MEPQTGSEPRRGGYTSEAKAWAENKKKNKQAASGGSSSGSGKATKGFNENGEIVDNVGEDNGKQKVIGKVTPNKNLTKTTNTAGDHQVAEGTDISESVQVDETSKWNAFEQIAYQQGYKNPAQIVTDSDAFDKLVEESGIIAFRSVNGNDDLGITGEDIVEGQKNFDAESFEFNGYGAKAFGYGMYFATNATTNGALPDEESSERAKEESMGYSQNGKGDVQFKATLQKGAKIGNIKELKKEFMNPQTAEEKEILEKFMRMANGNEMLATSMYAAAKGYDAMQVTAQDGVRAYTMVYNMSKLVIFDEYVEKF